MQKGILGFSKFFLLFFMTYTTFQSVIAMPKILWGLACTRDCNEIVALIDTFSDDDKAKLFVLPEQVRDFYIADAIKKERIWVARCNNEIISFIKLYIVTDPAELDKILVDELRCKGSNNKLLKKGIFDTAVSFSGGGFNDFERPTFTKNKIKKYNHESDDIYIYCGFTFTKEGYRGKSISSMLERSALEALGAKLISKLQEKYTKNGSYPSVFYIYGLVNANEGRLASVRIFSDFAYRYVYLKLGIQPLNIGFQKLFYYQYKAYKPSFQMDDDNRLQQLPDDEANEGMGCLLCLEL